MKKINSLIKLINLSSEHIIEKELRLVTGGAIGCGCGCFYADSGGSSREENAAANTASGLYSPDPSDVGE